MPNCETCKANREPESVPYIVHESAMARNERKEKRLIVVIILLIVLLVGSNTAWMIYESQFETVSTTIEQENDGGYNNYIGNDSDISNGPAEDNNH